jgi:hypothetical protein
MKEIKTCYYFKSCPALPWAVLMPSESSAKQLHAMLEPKLDLSSS